RPPAALRAVLARPRDGAPPRSGRRDDGHSCRQQSDSGALAPWPGDAVPPESVAPARPPVSRPDPPTEPRAPPRPAGGASADAARTARHTRPHGCGRGRTQVGRRPPPTAGRLPTGAPPPAAPPRLPGRTRCTVRGSRTADPEP